MIIQLIDGQAVSANKDVALAVFDQNLRSVAISVETLESIEQLTVYPIPNQNSYPDIIHLVKSGAPNSERTFFLQPNNDNEDFAIFLPNE